jgi:histone chaperone ASF1
MSVVNITNIQVLDNPTRLGNPFQFEITFECIAALQNGICAAF